MLHQYATSLHVPVDCWELRLIGFTASGAFDAIAFFTLRKVFTAS